MTLRRRAPRSRQCCGSAPVRHDAEAQCGRARQAAARRPQPRCRPAGRRPSRQQARPMAEELARRASLREHPRSRTSRRPRSAYRIAPPHATAQSKRRKSTSCASPFAVRVTPRRSVVGGPSVRRPVAGQGSKGTHRAASPHRGLCARRVAAGSCQTRTSGRTLVSGQLAAQVRRRHRPATGRRVCSGAAPGAVAG